MLFAYCPKLLAIRINWTWTKTLPCQELNNSTKSSSLFCAHSNSPSLMKVILVAPYESVQKWSLTSALVLICLWMSMKRLCVAILILPRRSVCLAAVFLIWVHTLSHLTAALCAVSSCICNVTRLYSWGRSGSFSVDIRIIFEGSDGNVR